MQKVLRNTIFKVLAISIFLLFSDVIACKSELTRHEIFQLGQLADQVMADTRFNIPGLSLTVRSRCGFETQFSKGVSKIGDSQKPGPQTLFRAGSVTKAFTGYLIMVLAQDGHFKVNSTLAEILPELREKLPGLDVDHITVRHLLNHTSGVPTYASLNQGLYAKVLQNPIQVWSQQDVIAEIAKAIASNKLSPPGSQFNYSNSNYYLLGLIAERVTHLSFEEALTRYVIRPLGLQHTFVPSPGNSSLPPESAHGYMETNSTNSALRDFSAVDPSYPWAAGSLLSTTSDLAQFAVAFQERQLLKGAFQDELFFSIPESAGYSYGVGLIRNENNQTIGHDGNIFGFECSSRYLVKRNLAVAACVNRSLFDQTLPSYSSLETVLMEKVFSLLNEGEKQSRFSEISDAKIEELRQAGKIQGLQLAFREGFQEPIIVKKYGVNRVGQSWADDDLLRIASVSKSFVAALFFKVAKTENLQLSDTIDRFFSPDLLPNIDFKKVSIGDLLKHSSGIPDYFTPEFIQIILNSLDRIKTDVDAINSVKNLKPDFEPGTSVKYSNTNYILLGKILDSVAQKRGYRGHQDLLRAEILQPMGLKSTFYDHKDAGLYNSAKIVSGFLDGQDFLKVEQGYGLPNGGLLSTVADMARFFSFIFNPGGRSYLGAEMMPSASESFGYGLYRFPHSPSFVGHTGEFAGHLSFAAFNPKNQITITAFCNASSNEAKAQFEKLQDYLFTLFED